ncbi:MAG: glycosyltransferase family 4 protein [Acidobacteria bacterium]|nr:glycosyltransferase family 4 protein [Acidobacteriota bacterium]
MRVLILNQAFYPDVVSTAQHAADLGCALAQRGDQVTVIASRRGYDDPSRRFSRTENWRGIRIVRITGTGLGKNARWRRAVDFASYLIACAWCVLWMPRQDAVIALTSPPLISFLAGLMVPLKARQLIIWSMDLNPDEAIAAGWLRRDSIVARLLLRMMTWSLRRAKSIIALDRFMAARIAAKGIDAAKIAVIPPWTHEEALHFTPEGRARFRDQHGLAGKFVVMHSGNHSPCHPLGSVLDAATRLKHDKGIAFCFIGGGSEMARIKKTAAERGLNNVVCLPYQPRQDLAASLSSGDLHVVPMGNEFVGIVHPCKIYNLLALGAPVLYLGPAISHITEIFAGGGPARAYSCRHEDIAGVMQAIETERNGGNSTCLQPSRAADFFSRQRLVPGILALTLSDARPAMSAGAETGFSRAGEALAAIGNE